MEGNTPYLVVNGLKKHYGNDEARVQVLDGITTAINKGEICVMLGPSWFRKIHLPEPHRRTRRGRRRHDPRRRLRDYRAFRKKLGRIPPP